MNTKIPVKKLSEKVAVSVDMPVDEVQSFIKILFDKIVDGLQQGESVTLPGLGKFVASSMPDEPVAFIPEREFSDAVNAPFVMFEPIPLSEGVTEEILDSVTTSESTGITQTTIVTEVSDNTQVPDTESDYCNDANIITEVSTPGPVINDDDKGVNEGSDNEIVEASDAAMDVCNDGDEPDEHSEPQQAIPNADIEVAQCVATAPENDVAINDAPLAIQHDRADDPSLFIPEDEEEHVVTSHGNDKPRFLQGFVVGLVTGLAIGALALFAYMVYFINTPTIPVE